MSTQEIEIPKWYQPQFTKNVESLLRKGSSVLRGTFTEASYQGNGAEVVKQYGTAKARVGNEDRGGDTPIMSTPRDSRWVFPIKVDIGDLFVKDDEIKQLIDPTSPIVTGFSNSMGEAIDESVGVPAFFGAARTGINGATSTAFPVDNSQDVNIQLGSANGATDTGMNVQKLLRARRLLKKAYVRFGREPVFCGLTSQEDEELQKDPLFTNRDYGTPTLDEGKVKSYLGFTFVEMEEYPTDAGGTIRYLPAWAKSGMHFGVWENLFTRMAESPGKQFNTVVYMRQFFGATRTQEKKVVRINIKIS